jgi:GTP-dependent phosphoenolpyruvate carboxykinase
VKLKTKALLKRRQLGTKLGVLSYKGGANFVCRYVPKEGALDTSGLNLSPEVLKELFKIDKAEWQNDLVSLRKFLSQFGEKVPKGITEETNALEQRLNWL